jgi:hypothetical protein
MQNRYTGDIGDYGKYALLKKLAGSDLRLGVVWYLNPHEKNNTDGKFVEYLREAKEDKYRPIDPGIYDALKKMVQDDRRQVESVRECGIFPLDTIFYETPLDYANLRNGEDRRRARKAWSLDALNNTTDASLVFFDPDKGLEVKSVSPHTKTGAEYVFEAEIQPFLDRDQSIVVYQHMNRAGCVGDQVRKGISRLRKLANDREGWAISFHSYSVRIYFVLPSTKHGPILQERTRNFECGPCKKVFGLKLYGL